MLLGLGVGYDFWIADQWSLGALARVVYAPLSARYTDSVTGESIHYSSQVVSPVLAITVVDH